MSEHESYPLYFPWKNPPNHYKPYYPSDFTTEEHWNAKDYIENIHWKLGIVDRQIVLLDPDNKLTPLIMNYINDAFDKRAQSPQWVEFNNKIRIVIHK